MTDKDEALINASSLCFNGVKLSVGRDSYLEQMMELMTSLQMETDSWDND
eukprot:gene7199-307_t